jgi:hypothetical protein
MVNTRFFIIFSCLIISHIYFGCGYTIVRDYDEEERQAELAAIDSLSSAPDLVISNVGYTYILPPPRQDALDQIVWPPRLQFHITISNIGNADFVNPFLIVYEYPNHDYEGRRSLSFVQCNKNHESISADSSHIIEFYESYPYKGGIFNFTIVTNPVLQRDLLRILRSQFNGPLTVTKSREIRYDNNESTITVVRK